MKEGIKKIYEMTKFDFEDTQDFKDPSKWPKNWVKIYYKTYPRMDKVSLVQEPYNPGKLNDALRKRESIRVFSNNPILFTDLSQLLFYSLGIKDKSINQPKRMYPSAGARYPIEAYLISNQIQGLDEGLFHYSPKNNELEVLLNENLNKVSRDMFGIEGEAIPNFLILTSVISRSEVKYELNAYRFSCIECGHIGQNFSLIASDKGLSYFPIGGFDNKKVEELLDLTDDEIPLYAFAFGMPK